MVQNEKIATTDRLDQLDSEENTLYWLWFQSLDGFGLGTQNKLIEQGYHPKDIYALSSVKAEAMFTPKQLASWNNCRSLDPAKRMLERCLKSQVQYIHREHPRYPKRLLQLSDPPVGLYLKGRFPEENQRCIAIIGARKADYYGLEMARYFARELAGKGVAVVSGLAYGVDGISHQGALDADGYTIGILGCGVNICYPKEHYKLYRRMEQMGGIVSEYGLDTSPKAGLFPMRNRLIAAMSDAILVTQARVRSGPLITVDQGLDLGRDIYAIPGRIGDELSEGCNDLIRAGAKMITRVDDVLEEWGVLDHEPEQFRIHKQMDPKNVLAKAEKIVYSVLRLEPKYIDTIIEETQLPISELLPALMHLEKEGYIKQIRQNYYSVKI